MAKVTYLVQHSSKLYILYTVVLLGQVSLEKRLYLKGLYDKIMKKIFYNILIYSNRINYTTQYLSHLYQIDVTGLDV